MLTIVCGEDTASSRRYFQELQKTYKEKGYYLVPLAAPEFIDALKEETGTFTLFNEKKAFVIDSLTRILSRKTSVEVKELIKKASVNPHLLILDWEAAKTAREITLKEAQIKEFKLPENIFKLLDACTPGNLAGFLRQFHELAGYVEVEFIYAMLCRHTRQLLLASQKALPPNVPTWQQAKLRAQAAKWPVTNLTAFYLGLARIDENVKTSSDGLGMQKAIDILAAFCLR